MIPEIRFTNLALEDLNSIIEYTKTNWSEIQAKKYYRILIDEIYSLLENFDNGRSMNQLRIGYKSFKVKSHIVFYKKDSMGNIEIIRILHQKMEVKLRLM